MSSYSKYILSVQDKVTEEFKNFDLPYDVFKLVVTDRINSQSVINDMNIIFSRKVENDSKNGKTLSKIADFIASNGSTKLKLSVGLEGNSKQDLLNNECKVTFSTYRIENANFDNVINTLVEKLIIDVVKS